MKWPRYAKKTGSERESGHFSEQTFLFGIRKSDNAGLTTIDIIAHEWTHALLGVTVKLQDSENPELLLKAFCDIMAKAVQFWSYPFDTNWSRP